MGYKAGFSTGAHFVADDNVRGSWLQGDFVARVLLAPFERAGVLTYCTHISIDFGDPKPITPSEILAQSSSWGYDHVSLFSGPDDDDPDCLLLVTLQDEGFRVILRAGGGVLDALRPRLLELGPAWVVGWTRELPTGVQLLGGDLNRSQKDYPRPRPPRTSPLWSLGLIQHYVGLARSKADPQRAPVVEQLLHKRLPDGATRRIDGDVLILTFVHDLRDDAAVAAARAEHEEWMAPIVGAEPERGWNAAGDRLIVVADAPPRDPLTFYAASSSIGYKAIVVQLDGSIDEEQWAELLELLRTKALPDGSPLAQLRLIVPRRADALRIDDRARADGFEMVTYPGEGVFWQVNPK